ncbi:MAG: polysaccharide biosynthesis/export family protein [Nitrospirae bacterium]|nr:polysaccharide biosynthesis/export family protein [Nitrospirota bacterium]
MTKLKDKLYIKMIYLLTILSLMLVLFSPSSSFSETPSQNITNMSEVEVVDFLTNLTSSYTEGDAEKYASFYSDRVIENGFGKLEGIKSGYLKDINNNSAFVFEIEISEIKTIGNYAIINGTYHKILVSKSDEKTIDSSGNIRIKIKKEKDLKIEKIDYDNYITNDYVIGPEDVVEISVWKDKDLSTITIVRPDGIISLPLIGDQTASGLTAKELGELIANKLEEYKQSPIVSVIVREINSKAVYITGEILRPGKYPLKSDTTIVQALTLGGGFTQWAKKDKIVIIRKNPLNSEGDRISVRYSDIISGKDLKANILLKNGDTIIVP